MEESGISDLLRSERMGHEVPGMRGVYGHVSPAMRADLTVTLQERWEASLRRVASLGATRFSTLLASVRTGSDPSVTCVDAGRVTAGEQRRTGVNETRTETRPGTVSGATARPAGGL